MPFSLPRGRRSLSRLCHWLLLFRARTRHLQGARHDEADDGTSSPFPYGHGLQHLSPSPAWRTIMAYNCGTIAGGCPRLQYWSNPDISHNSFPMGTEATNNNARVLDETATTVADFRNAPTASG